MKTHLAWTLGLCVAAATACGGARTASAQHVHAGDIVLELQGGVLVTGTEHDDGLGGHVFEPARVFEGELGEEDVNLADHPGFDSEPGTFPYPSNVGFNLLDALRVWDGTDFDTIAAEPRMKVWKTVGLSTFGALTPTTANTVVPGFALPVAADGTWHEHLNFELVDAAGDAAATPYNGVFLLTLDLFNDTLANSNAAPTYVVLAQGVDEADHEAAVDYVQANIVPEPASFALGALPAAFLGWCIFRRRAVRGA